MAPATIEEIEAILRVINQSDFTILISGSEKNILTQLDLNIPELGPFKNIVRSLRPGDYSTGPDENRDNLQNGPIWIFKKLVLDIDGIPCNMNFYIKFFIQLKYKLVVSMSCHYDEELHYEYIKTNMPKWKMDR